MRYITLDYDKCHNMDIIDYDDEKKLTTMVSSIYFWVTGLV